MIILKEFRENMLSILLFSYNINNQNKLANIKPVENIKLKHSGKFPMDVMHESFSNASSPPLRNRYNAPVSYVSYLYVNVNCCWTSMIN